MFSPDLSWLLAADQTLLSGLPTLFNVSTAWFLPLVLAIVAMVLGVLYGKSIRMEDHGWRVGLIAASFLASLAIILFWPYKLGVDLQGGAILVYEVDEQETAANHPEGKADDWKMSELMLVLKRRLNPDGLKEIVIRPFGPKQVEIVVPEVDSEEVEKIKKDVTQTGVLRFLILADSENKDRTVRDAAAEQALDPNETIRRQRIVRDPTDETKTIGLWVDIRRKSVKGAEFQEFKEATGFYGTLLRNAETGEVLSIPNPGEMQANPALYFHNRKIKNVQVLMVVDPELDVRGNDLAAAQRSMDQGGAPCISFIMKADSTWKMTALTGQNKPVGNVTRKLGIVWDNVLESAPAIQSQINQHGQITGNFSLEEVAEKVDLLKSGSMPVVMKREPISDDRIGATLGAETVRSGSQAIVISLSIVLGFVMFYYRAAGFIACFALVLNMMLTVALMFALKAPFTLPGLAGLVLTVGMSVDANVLIYERIREELERGAALRMAIRNGFDKALVTIIDSNVTTLLTAVILYVIGTDQVRGFGMTLILGIVTSMFTAIFASRAILEIGEKAYRWQTLSMLKFFTHMHIDWMKLFKPTATVSVILIVIGLVATVVRGKGIFDTDLAGGTTAQFRLNSAEYPDITEPQVRAKMAAAFEGVTEGNSKAEYSIYQNFVTAKSESGKEERQMVWKVDSSLQDVTKLQEVIRKAFQKDGKEGLQTYNAKFGEVAEVQPAAPVVPPPVIGAEPAATPNLVPGPNDPPKTDSPAPQKTETPKEDPAKPDAPKTDTPKTDPAKPESPAKEEPKEGDPKKSDEAKSGDAKSDETKKDDSKKEDAKKDDKQDSSDCQPGEDGKKDDEKKDEPKKPDTKSEDKPEAKTDEPKAEPTKPEATKPEATKPEPADPAKPDPAAENDPNKVVPPPVEPPGVKLPTAANQIRSSVELKLGAGKIGGAALLEKIAAAAKTAVGQSVVAEARSPDPGWTIESSKAFSDWNITLPLPKADAEKVLQQVQQDLGQEVVWQSSSKIGGQVAVDTQWRALGAIVGSIFVMIVYMWIRFHKISWGIAAAVALAHDALVMLGAIAVSYWLAGPLGFLMVEEFKISLPVVAAFLTLIGYSINDTIVIFDRVREIRGKSPDVTGQMINDAVNQTLSRTFLTAGTTLMVIVILYFLGGSGIHAFAFSLVVGVISGSYSTVFIASPLLVYLIGLDQENETKKVATTPASKTRGAA